MDLNTLTLKQAILGLKEKEFSSIELTTSCLEKIKKVDEKIKAFVTVCSETSLTQAGEADKQLSKNNNDTPLLGIPVAIKDNFLTKGIKTTASSKVLENYLPVYESTVTSKLKKAGAIIIGKTNMDAWAHGSSTETSQFFTTKNPWNIEKLPGGSSGGSAAAISADMAIFSIGSETAGSIRQPASWCGVTGLKPSYGAVSRYGVIAMASSTDSPGPIAKTVEDAELIFKIISGKDEFDATSVESNPIPVKKNIIIGIPKEYFFEEIEPDIKLQVKEAIKLFEQEGMKIMEISLLDPKYSIADYTIIQRAEVSSNLARYDGIRYGNNRSYFGDEAKRRIMLGTHVLSSGYFDAYYLNGQKVRTLICNDFQKSFEKVDVILSPTTPCTALPVGSSKDEPMFGELQDILVEASSLAGLPGISIPCGFDKNNLPIGMQLIGPRFSEDLLLYLGKVYQQKTDWHTKRPII